MIRFVLRRLLVAIPIVFLSSLLTFVLVINAGTPAPIERLLAQQNHSQASVQALRAEYHLDEPWYQRYWDWSSKAVHGDFGTDNDHHSVWSDDVWPAMLVTLRLVLIAELLALFLGVSVGVLSAVRQYSWFDYSSTGLAFFFYAMPVFLFAVLLKEFGAIKFNEFLSSFGWDRVIKTVGYQTTGLHGNIFARLGDSFGYTILPVITLTVISFATYSRFQRASMLDTLKSDYVRTARAKGVPNRTVLIKHALRNALIPVTTLVAIDFGVLLGGAVITEHVFGWPGMGTLFINSVNQVDPNVLLCWLVVVATMVVIFNILADIAYAYLDPRIRID